MADGAPPQPPGWYHGEGDPPGTQRYWNGSTWIGQPREMSAGYGGPPLGRVQYASWWARAGALVLDWIIVGAVWFCFFLLAGVLETTAPTLRTISLIAGVVVIIALPIYNYCFLQSWNGATVGKRLLGIAVVRERSNHTLPASSLFGRWAMTNCLGILCNIGALLDHLWPLWDDKNQTIHDKVVSSIVVRVDSLDGSVPLDWAQFHWRSPVGGQSYPGYRSANEPWRP